MKSISSVPVQSEQPNHVQGPRSTEPLPPLPTFLLCVCVCVCVCVCIYIYIYIYINCWYKGDIVIYFNLMLPCIIP